MTSSYECPLSSVTTLGLLNFTKGEYPNIYARICSLPTEGSASAPSSTSTSASGTSSVIVITDTGVGTSVPNLNDTNSEPAVWTICSFLEHTVNPGHRLPYLFIISHCHYDHILGLQRFIDEIQDAIQTNAGRQAPSITILSSACAPSFLQPWSTLERNSLCIEDGLTAPKYDIDIWAGDNEQIFLPITSGVKIPLPITTFHTPGHTPDSLTWYDHTYRTLYVGDHVYYRESPDGVNAPWGRESVSPIIFCLQSDVADWLASIDKLLALVLQQNNHNENDSTETDPQRVRLSAGHASVAVDAEKCLNAAKTFMGRVLRGEVPQFPRSDFQGCRRSHWKDTVIDDPLAPPGFEKISVIATVRVIEEARRVLLPPPLGVALDKSKPDLKMRDVSIEEASKLSMNIVVRTSD